jgi:hypothetical protein
MLWIDGPDAGRLLGEVDPTLREPIGRLMDEGVTILRRGADSTMCDRVIEDFRRYCEEHPAEKESRDEHGLHSRLCNFHLASTRFLALGLNPTVLPVLDCLFGAPAGIATSLLFERGSEQKLHRDSPFFHTDPEGHFLAAWTALEPVGTENGPLAYYLGGHAPEIDRFAVRDAMPGRPVIDMLERYQAEVLDACRAEGLPYVEATDIQKGDVIIWHPRLPHGGAPVKDPTFSRLSAVFHYVPRGCEMRGVETFFSGEPFTGGPFPTLSVAGRHIFDQGAPLFLPNA